MLCSYSTFEVRYRATRPKGLNAVLEIEAVPPRSVGEGLEKKQDINTFDIKNANTVL